MILSLGVGLIIWDIVLIGWTVRVMVNVLKNSSEKTNLTIIILSNKTNFKKL